ncbi:MAG TPA: beta-L-arabinofuranosidase domain-containing protein [Vicinamibacteria bacterium]|nr:beta-L-arabinofuranosidase domain-containing protein [Vicinamibacteria bacterium]
MRGFIAALAISVLAACGGGGVERPVSEGPIRAVPFTSVRLTDSFWAPRLVTNRTVTIPHIMRQNEETGRVDNFRKAAGRLDGTYQGRRFNDTDIYKVMEAASYALAQKPHPALDAELDELIALIEVAQEIEGVPKTGPGAGANRHRSDA